MDALGRALRSKNVSLRLEKPFNKSSYQREDPMRRTPSTVSALMMALGATAYFSDIKPSVAQDAACAFPTAASSTMEETAWRLFVAANCPGNGTQVVWENWIEQSSLYPAGAAQAVAANQAPPRLHGSPLARAEMIRTQGLQAALAPSSECNKMGGPPPNVKPGATICEEARLNPEAEAFVRAQKFQARPGQTSAAEHGEDIEFPTPAIEVKVDWIPASDFSPPFTCSDPPSGVRVETVEGQCYAMAGMHISSKLLPRWLWATFEPQSMLTNPLRCITFGPCNDHWGSSPASSEGGPGGFTQQTPGLKSLMLRAKLAPPFFNYRLDGVQADFTNPMYLGNSVIEGENVGMTKNTASCITCHSVSSIENNGTDGITVLAKMNPPVGPQYMPPAGWIARDFVWSLGLACPVPAGTFGLQTCR